jgi:hypothetical protein
MPTRWINMCRGAPRSGAQRSSYVNVVKLHPDNDNEVRAPDPFSLPFSRYIEWAGLIGGLALLAWAVAVGI